MKSQHFVLRILASALLLGAGMLPSWSRVKALQPDGNPSTDKDAPLWLRPCAISPDGATIAFSYKGDLWTVSSKGGQAKQLTTNRAYDSYPVWSPDGSQLAFASNREGSLDIFVMPAYGGTPQRLTTSSLSEVPVLWTDKEGIIYKSTGMPTTADLQFTSSTFYHLYSVSPTGGRPKMFSALTIDQPSMSKDGRLLYTDVKGYEDPWRKHQVSSVARDIWMMKGGKYKRLTTDVCEDRNAIWAPDGESIYWLSEKDGTFNVWHRDVAGTKVEQVTRFKGNPVRHLTIAQNGLLCFSQNGEIYTKQAGKRPERVNVHIVADLYQRGEDRSLRSNGATAMSACEKSKEVAFILNGDVYVTSMDYKTTKQVTNTNDEERGVAFSKDGKTLVYARETNGEWQLYKATASGAYDEGFAYSTDIQEVCLTPGQKGGCMQPLLSPDGKKIAFLRDRHELCVMSIDGGKITTLIPASDLYSYSDGDQHFSWSPDSKWLLAGYIPQGGWQNRDIALVKADGSQLHNVTNSGYNDDAPRWALGGKAMIFSSDRAGYRSHGSWGSENDIYLMFFDPEAYDDYCMNKEEKAIKEKMDKQKADKEKEAKEKAEKEKKEKAEKEKKDSKKKSKKGKATDKNDDKTADKKEAKEEMHFDLENLDDRTIRLTTVSGRLGDALLSKDGEKLFYVAPNGNGTAVWVQEKNGGTSIKMGSVPGYHWQEAEEGNSIYTCNDRPLKVNLDNGQTTTYDFQTFITRRDNETRLRQFEHIWRTAKDKLYDPGMNGADWDRIHDDYVRMVPHVNNNTDFAVICAEMLGELNVSHSGCKASLTAPTLQTASLGVFYDEAYEGDGLKIKEIPALSPLTKIHDKVAPGALITHIDGEAITAGKDYYPLLAVKAGQRTRLTVKENGKVRDVFVRPITLAAEDGLMYHRWVKRNREMVDKLSGGRLAYVHIKEMNAASFHTLYKELLSAENRVKEAVIVDTRHNGGGWLHDDICVLLSGKKVTDFMPRGQYIASDPFNRWTKPSCMMVCEDNYSNAHGTPFFYKELGLGKVIGAPVPGTMTAVWWEHLDGGLVYGIPEVASIDARGHVLENQQLEPDVEVYNSPEDVLSGRDRQLERAVKELLK